jgi:hypothetical protein
MVQENIPKNTTRPVIRLNVVCVAVLAATAFSFSQTSSPLIAQFSELLKGRYAKIIWMTRVPGQIYGNQVWGMDTKDCIPHQITRDADLAPGNAQLYDPVMTWDQRRVVVTDGNSMTVYVVNFDGSGFKKVVTGNFSGGAWRQNNTDWILTSAKTSPTARNASVYRVNIDTPTVKVLLWNKTITGSGTSFHPSLSVDGTRMGENYPHPSMGIATVPNGSLSFSNKALGEICVPTMSRDNKYQCLCWNFAHTNFIIFDTTGNSILNKDFTTSLPFNGTTNQAHWLRWSNDYDIATVDNFVVRISDLQKVDMGMAGTAPVAIEVFVYGVAAVKTSFRLKGTTPQHGRPAALYDCLGRKIRRTTFTGLERRGTAPGAYFAKTADKGTRPAHMLQTH